MAVKDHAPRRRLSIVGGVGLAAALGLGAALTWPPRTGHIRSTARPAGTYDEALERFAELHARDDATINPNCRSQLLGHGGPTASVVLLLHGMTNCPIQFAQFGQLLYDAGHTVMIPRLPRNGLADRRTNALGRLRAAELAACGDETLDIALGLGKRVTVLGLSAGGLIAAFLAQHRPELARAIVVAPALGVRNYALPYQAALRNAFLRVPNLMLDDAAEAVAVKPVQNYVRSATRSLGELMLLGESVLRSARHDPPAVSDIILVTNGADTVISNAMVALLAERWRRHGHVEQFEFSADKQLPHDLIDPQQPAGRPDLVYPILQQMIERKYARCAEI
jgi:pimeloyl-ACP methyl ester carboxylesterase